MLSDRFICSESCLVMVVAMKEKMTVIRKKWKTSQK